MTTTSARSREDHLTDPLDELLKQVDSLPTLPEVQLQAAEHLSDLDCDLQKVVSIVALDPVLTGRLIQLANSPFFGSVGRSTSLLSAMNRVGAREARNLIMSAAVIDVLKVKTSSLDLRAFWTLGLASAISARRIARDIFYTDQDKAYLGGLLHCIGEAVVAIYFPDRFSRALEDTRTHTCGLVEAVWAEFRFTHPVLSRRVLEKWNFPADVIEAVEYHLDPDEAPNETLLASIIFASDRICRELGLGGAEPCNPERLWLDDIPADFVSRIADVGYPDMDAYVSVQKEQLAEVGPLVNSIFSRG